MLASLCCSHFCQSFNIFVNYVRTGCKSFLVFCTFDVLLRERLTHSHSIIYFLNIEFVFFFFGSSFVWFRSSRLLIFLLQPNRNEIKETKQLLLREERRQKLPSDPNIFWFNRFFSLGLCVCVCLSQLRCNIPNFQNDRDVSDSFIKWNR